MNIAYNTDCMEYMRTLPENAFDLAVVDPPYGIGVDAKMAKGALTKYGRSKAKRSVYHCPHWDKSKPSKEYFDELRRVSRNQIIWGANHFISQLPFDSPCWIVWDKDNGNNGYADCELAWTSFGCAVRKFKWRWHGMLQEDMAHKEKRIHPTQKPVALYDWLLRRFANPGDKILDTHLGSGSSRIAAYRLGYDFVGCEIDATYFAQQEDRFKRATGLDGLFSPEPL